jgi:perosamine synthetase
LPIIERGRGRPRIPLAAPNISDEDRLAVCEALESTTIAYGPKVREFETAVAAITGSHHALATQSGTAALHLALLVSGVAPGDDVLMPTLTYVAHANAILYVGARPVLLDVEPAYRQLDVERAAAFIDREYRRQPRGLVHRVSGSRLSAILAVDLLGHPCDIDRVIELARHFGLAVIDDAAEAFGARVGGHPLGSIAPVSVLSFNANKLITTGGGGMLLCRSPEHDERGRLLASHFKERDSIAYIHEEVGFNYGMAAAQAALGTSQLRRFDEFLANKRATAARYCELLCEHPAIELPRTAPWAEPSHWLFTIQVPAKSRDRLIEELGENGIETRPMFEAMHRVGAHRDALADECRVAEELADGGVALPSSTALEDDELEEVAAAVLDVLARLESGASR